MSIPKESESVARPEPQNPQATFQNNDAYIHDSDLNINGIANNNRIRMLEDLWAHDIDIALLQEVIFSQLKYIR
jgi:hypothetical protein